MADKITTLHPKNQPQVNVYPNVKAENIIDTIPSSKMGFTIYVNYVRISYDEDDAYFTLITTSKLEDMTQIANALSTSDWISATGFYQGKTINAVKYKNDTSMNMTCQLEDDSSTTDFPLTACEQSVYSVKLI